MRMALAARTCCLASALSLLAPTGPCFGQSASPSYRPVSQGEASRLVLGRFRDWARDWEEVRAFRRELRETGSWAGLAAAVGAIGYFEGGRGSARLGNWDLRMDTAGQSLQSLLRRGEAQRLGLGLGRRDLGWSADFVLGLREGRFLSDAVNLGYKIRY